MIESKLPTRGEALVYLVESGCSKAVVEHCKAVSMFARKIAEAFTARGFNIDLKLIEIGGLLHDIGRSKTHTVDHGVAGGEIARSLGVPSSVVRVIERHVGGGIPKAEAERLGWLAKDFLPKTWEEKIVCYADKRIEGLRVVSIGRAEKTYAASLGEGHPALYRIKKLHDEIVAVVGEF
ncbi:MAG TPA: HDIG domain-containing protein [Candidatus Bathyarchaeia archaeon]|nr:HDIG domain-containing protein [Candidatus Bathyarchaeia archaeon]